ncbi:MAG TPA: serine/threonine-protein kinase, partial [Vicinamibacteria bacterium]|nr:serine/threonine-protein kinase [Vicinamibacteria bacterium]
MIARRYRIVAPLGRGGMGEVYRADDLKLGHAVALKFLPPAVAADRDRLERLFAEVRVGRQVSHPNVCRLYDVVESEGGHFVAMEYVDGEDLAALLRRIGHLPLDKALELARDIGAGLAAAHDRGVVHRDLKPANVMVDGHGRARITDFGLAVLMEHGDDAVLAGTPVYMAPEQLAGGPATVRSDLYALGLVFYEMFTGKRRFEAASVPDLIAQHRESRPLGLSSSVRGLPPAVERVIARCLEEDPASRPPSAHAVIATLPVGDALQAAIDAGETPSPAMVAAAGRVGDLKPAVAWSLLAATLAGMAIVATMASRTMLVRKVPLPKPPEVLKERARDIAARLGYTEPAVDTAGLFAWDDDYIRYVAQRDRSPNRWDRLATARPAPISFHYRESPRHMLAENDEHRALTEDPPLTLPGMIQVALDPAGRLSAFTAVPPRYDAAPAAGAEPDWTQLFAEAGLDAALLRPAASAWSAPVDSDRKAAWDGTYPGQADTPIHVEAASYHGRPVWFSVLGPWTPREAPGRVAGPLPGSGTAQGIFLAALFMTQIATVLLARRNVRAGRSDRRGAWRLAILAFAAWLVAGLIRADHFADVAEEYGVMTDLVTGSLYWAALLWVLYVALEPYARRRWPHTLISWSRLVAGRLTDPMVGRDLLVGVTLAVAIALTAGLITSVLPAWLGGAPLSPRVTLISPLGGAKHMVFALFRFLPIGTAQALVGFCMLLLLRVLLRKESLAIAAFAAISFTYNFGTIRRGENLALEV